MSLSQHVDHGRARLRDAGQTLASKVTHLLPTSEKPEARADDNYPSLSVPLVTLYVAAACPEQSKEAFRMLEATNTAFRVETSRDDTITARFAGKTQHGLEGVERLAEGLKGFASALLDTTGNEAYAAELERRFDPALGERTRAELADYNRTAKAELATILHGGADSER